MAKVYWCKGCSEAWCSTCCKYHNCNKGNPYVSQSAVDECCPRCEGEMKISVVKMPSGEQVIEDCDWRGHRLSND